MIGIFDLDRGDGNVLIGSVADEEVKDGRGHKQYTSKLDAKLGVKLQNTRNILQSMYFRSLPIVYSRKTPSPNALHSLSSYMPR